MTKKIIVTKSVHSTINVELQGSFPEETLHFFRSMDVRGGHGEIVEIKNNRIYRTRYELPSFMYLLFDELPFVQRDKIIVEYPLEKVITNWDELQGLESCSHIIEVNTRYYNGHVRGKDKFDEDMMPSLYLSTHTFYTPESCRGITELLRGRYNFDIILRCPECVSVAKNL